MGEINRYDIALKALEAIARRSHHPFCSSGGGAYPQRCHCHVAVARAALKAIENA